MTAWRGNRVTGDAPRVVTDGATMLLLSAVRPRWRKPALRQCDFWPPVTPRKALDRWRKTVKASRRRVVVDWAPPLARLGPYQCVPFKPLHGGGGVFVDGVRLREIGRAVRWTRASIEKIDVRCPVVLWDDKAAVAIIMPLTTPWSSPEGTE